jgi:hypothetical protein
MSGLNISVVMCTYNGARFLREQLESIAAQIRLPDELIICDDCSTDETIEIVNAFTGRARFPVRLEINARTLGVTKNFERAIELCSWEIISLADQDDIWHPQKLECIANLFLRSLETIAVFSDAELIDPESRPVQGRLWDSFLFAPKEQEYFANGNALEVLLKHPVITGATMAFRERFRGLVLPIPINHMHDRWISILLAACGHIRPIPNSLIKYRLHGGQQCGAGAGRLTLVRQTQIAKSSGRQPYLEEVECFRQIGERLLERETEFPWRQGAMKLIADKIIHRSARANLPQSRVLRLPAVLGQVINRGYWHY